ncbi:bifunctional metallophosphatase/5'-nucleotidase [Adhaeribacter soli]|uniref:Bifunctional metallophosphatase/5'-nucleotidase n=1 Tax=Adhaeribacter soli TaxID=2607655 RepID=A0A5N1J7L8_9BACT|nr:metallophosphatase [Adhaeribacter soli]KAA9340800.1 bifunctional metallophosphatase/5'-nucleotidase [Adhaeribacter soli]
MNRRDFLRNTLLGAAGLGLLGLPSVGEAKGKTRKLVILHTNDMHSRIDPFPNDGRSNGGMGGMARRAALVKEIRSKEKNVLLLDSGDIFQGTPYFNFFGGELEYKLMTMMGYDAATFGNHDFDNGLEGLQKQLPHAGFPFLSANYDFSNTILKDKFQPYKVFEKDGLKIGVFGLGIELKGLVADNMIGQTVYLDPVKKAKEIVKILREEQECNLVICLSHLGYKYETDKVDDRKLAAQVGGIDLILGGHTHTFLEKPDTIISPGGNETLINQVGWAGINLGRIDFEFSRDGRKNGYAAAVLPVDERTVISS